MATTHIPHAIILKIYYDYIFNCDELKSGLLLSKSFNKDIYKLYQLYQKSLEIKSLFPEHIINAFGSINKFITYPRLEFQDKFMGSTQYIDRIRSEDLSDPIMYGVDYYSRSFITLKLKYHYILDMIDEDIREYYNEKVKKGVITVFQRYTGDNYAWTTGTAYGMSDIFETGLLYAESYKAINELVRDGTVIFRNKKISLSE